jgi:3-hydroxyacyl-CoA dehydrogenase
MAMRDHVLRIFPALSLLSTAFLVSCGSESSAQFSTDQIGADMHAEVDTAPGQTRTEIYVFLKDGFTNAAMAKVGTSAIESRKLGYILESDTIVANKDELLFVAMTEAKAMYDAGYRAPHKKLFPVAGRNAKATIMGQLANMRDGGFISQHDFHISTLIADVVTGGDVDAGSMVSEEYLMALERKHFCALLDNPKTQERIMGMLQTGKPVRN